MKMTKRLPLAVALAGLIGAGTLTMALTAYADQDADKSATSDSAHPHFAFSPADRAAFLDARLAALHAGLELTADQEKLWPPVESAFRDLHRTVADARQKARSEPRPADPIARLQQIGDNQIARGEALKKLADAAAPLYSALNDDQKHRLPILLRATHLGFAHRHFARWRFAQNDRWGDHGGFRRHWDRRGDDFGRHEDGGADDGGEH
jgi:zinc resistance-associated protein